MQFARFKLMNAAIVVALDMRSSSLVFDDLAATNNLNRLGGFISSIKHHLAEVIQPELPFDPHKFSGDAWILLFLPDTDGHALLRALHGLCVCYDREYRLKILPNLECPPPITGLAFGVDAGPLKKLTIFQETEYVARALNVACRLQLKAKEPRSGYTALVSAATFEKHCANVGGFKIDDVTHDLKNIRNGKDFPCKRIELFAPKD